jgi:hypothetical protein
MASPVGTQGSRFVRFLTRGLRSQLVRWVVVVTAITLVTLGYRLRPVVEAAVGSILTHVMQSDDAGMRVTVTSGWCKPIFLRTSSPGGSNVPFQTMEDDADAKSQRARKIECRSLPGDRIASAM